MTEPAENHTVLDRIKEGDTADIHGVNYTLIAARLRMFREDHKDWSIKTKISFKFSAEDPRGNLVHARCIIRDDTGRIISTGHAEEERDIGNINKTSAVENAETSAVGRALAFVSGEYAGSAIRSADEMADALSQQLKKKMWAVWAAHTAMVEKHHQSLLAIRELLANDNFDAAREAWDEIPNEDTEILWRATTKGGWFTPRERQQMKWWSNDFEKTRGHRK